MVRNRCKSERMEPGRCRTEISPPGKVALESRQSAKGLCKQPGGASREVRADAAALPRSPSRDWCNYHI